MNSFIRLIIKFFLIFTPIAVLGNGSSLAERWKVAPIVYSLNENDKVGTLKAGFVCLPSGTLRWNDIKLPRDYELTEKAMVQINESLSKGLNLSTKFYQLKGRMDKFELKLCVAGLGIGEKKPKGEGKIEIQWTKLRWPEGTAIQSETVQSTFVINGTDPRKNSDSLQQGIIQNLAKFLLLKNIN
jgi:hypothetical protein